MAAPKVNDLLAGCKYRSLPTLAPNGNGNGNNSNPLANAMVKNFNPPPPPADLADAEAAFLSLLSEAEALPGRLVEAVESADAVTVIELRQRERSLPDELVSAEVRFAKLVEDHQQKLSDYSSDLTAPYRAALEELEEMIEAAEVARDLVAQISLELSGRSMLARCRAAEARGRQAELVRKMSPRRGATTRDVPTALYASPQKGTLR